MVYVAVILFVTLIIMWLDRRWLASQVALLRQVNDDLQTALDDEFDASQQFLNQRIIVQQELAFYKGEVSDEKKESVALCKQLQEVVAIKETLLDTIYDLQDEQGVHVTALEVESNEHEMTRAKLRNTEAKVEALITLSETLSHHVTDMQAKVYRLTQLTDELSGE